LNFTSTITEVNYQALRDHCNIKAVIFDKDNTLTAPYINSIHPDAHPGLQSALDAFGKKNVAILSNSAGTNDDIGHEDAKEIENKLGIAVILHQEKKPGGLSEVMHHFPDVKEPSELCMVGDRLLTDIVFGNLHGMLTVHTLPLCSGKDNKGDNKIASLIRSAENTVMYGNWWGGRKMRANVPEHKWWKGEESCPLIIARGEDELGSLLSGDEKKDEL
jgi:phosphatidylglycerophosphatase GEP4